MTWATKSIRTTDYADSMHERATPKGQGYRLQAIFLSANVKPSKPNWETWVKLPSILTAKNIYPIVHSATPHHRSDLVPSCDREHSSVNRQTNTWMGSFTHVRCSLNWRTAYLYLYNGSVYSMHPDTDCNNIRLYTVYTAQRWTDCHLDGSMNPAPRFSNYVRMQPFHVWRNCYDCGPCASGDRLLCNHRFSADCTLCTLRLFHAVWRGRSSCAAS